LFIIILIHYIYILICYIIHNIFYYFKNKLQKNRNLLHVYQKIINARSNQIMKKNWEVILIIGKKRVTSIISIFNYIDIYIINKKKIQTIKRTKN